jgi:hypothetical protein
LIVAGAILLRPEFGLYLAAATVPLDAAGRLGNLLAHINISIAKIAVLVMVVAWAIHVVTRGARVLWAPEVTLLCVYLGFAGLSLIDTREFTLGYQAALRLGASILFYLLVVNLVRTREQFLRTLAILTAVSVLTFGFGVAQRYIPSQFFEHRTGWEDPGAQTFGVEKHRLDPGTSESVARRSGVAYHAIIMAVNTDLRLLRLSGQDDDHHRVQWIPAGGPRDGLVRDHRAAALHCAHGEELRGGGQALAAAR